MSERGGLRGWSGPGGEPTTLLLVRHGATPHTAEKRFSGGLAGSNPGLSGAGREQVRAMADWLKPRADGVDALVTSPVRRTRESAAILADVLGLEPEEESGFAEMEFGTWDGMTFAEVSETYREELSAWLGSMDVAAGQGESFRTVQSRVRTGLERVLTAHAGRTVVVVTHVTPIKILLGEVLGAPLEAVYRSELSPASLTVLSFYPPTGTGNGEGRTGDGTRPHGSVRLFNALPGALPTF